MSYLTTTVGFQVSDPKTLADQLAARYKCLSGRFINDCAQKVCPSASPRSNRYPSSPDVPWIVRQTVSDEERLFSEQMIREWQAKNLTDANITYIPPTAFTFR